MELKNRVTSLELSQRLKALGVKQESLFYWVKGLEISEYPEGDDYESWYEKDTVEIVNRLQAEHAKRIIKDNDPDNDFCPEVYSAYTSGELGEIFPTGFASYRVNKKWVGYKKGDDWCVTDGRDRPLSYAETEADARAKGYIYLLEQGLLKI